MKLPHVSQLCVHRNDPNNCFHCGTNKRRFERPLVERIEPEVALLKELASVVQPSAPPTEDEVRDKLGIESPTQVAQPLRRFFQPLPEGSCPQWLKDVDGLSPQNIAMILVMPQILFTDYGKYKDNPPAQIAVPSPTSYGRKRFYDGLKPAGSKDTTIPDPGLMIVVEPAFEMKQRKIPASNALLDELDKAKVKRDALNVEFRTAKKNKTSNLKKIDAARRKNYREIAELEESAKGSRGWVDVPRTPHKLAIPPRPEGCRYRFPISEVRKFVEEAFVCKLPHETDEDWYERWDRDRGKFQWNRTAWSLRWAALENHVIKLAWHEGVIAPWSESRSEIMRSRSDMDQMLDGVLNLDPREVSRRARDQFKKMFPDSIEELSREKGPRDWTIFRGRRVSGSMEAKDAALTGYNVSEGGFRSDFSSRHNHRGVADPKKNPELQGLGTDPKRYTDSDEDE